MSHSKRMDKQDVVHLHLHVKYCSAVKKNGIMIFAGKWMTLEKKTQPEWDNSDPERQMWHVFSYKWILAAK